MWPRWFSTVFGVTNSSCAISRFAAGGYAHGGSYTINGRTVVTCHGKFPGNVEVALVVNSKIGAAGTHPCTTVANAVKSAT